MASSTVVHDVPLGRDPVTDLHAFDEVADGDHIAGELVSADEWRPASPRSPRVPLVDVHVGAADTGAPYAYQDLVVADRRLRNFRQGEAASRGLLHQRFHVTPRREPERRSGGCSSQGTTKVAR